MNDPDWQKAAEELEVAITTLMVPVESETGALAVAMSHFHKANEVLGTIEDERAERWRLELQGILGLENFLEADPEEPGVYEARAEGMEEMDRVNFGLGLVELYKFTLRRTLKGE